MAGLKAVLRVARTEVIEHRRQRGMLVFMVLGYALWATVFTSISLLLETVASDEATLNMIHSEIASMGLGDGPSAWAQMVKVIVSNGNALLFTSLPLLVAIMSGYSVLHDRLHGVLPFIMLAPIRRWHFLLGKTLGAMAIPVLLHLLGVGTYALVNAQLDVLAEHSALFGGSAAWWLAYLFGAPATAFLVGAMGTVISGLSRDVRTSMQATSFFISIMSLVFGYALVEMITEGWLLQIAMIAACAVLGCLTLMLGSKIVSRDVRPSLH